VDFELARRHCAYTFNTITVVTVTNDPKGIKVKVLKVHACRFPKEHISHVIVSTDL
jgi:hypothetical protein